MQILRRNGRVLIAAAFATTLFAVYLLFRVGFGSGYLGEDIILGAGYSLPASEPQFEGYTPLPSHVADLFTPLDKNRQNYHEWNAQTLLELHSCIALKNCGTNQKKVALLASHWIEDGVVRAGTGGEAVWARSIYKNLRAMGYTILFSTSFEEALEQYRQFPDLVRIVIRHSAGECHANPECVKGPSNPQGIPAWKIFDFEFFPSLGEHPHAQPLKGKWILSANPQPNMDFDEAPMQYIGYSIEEECQSKPVIRLSERSNQGWLLMQQIKYAYDNRFAWDRSFFSKAAQETGLRLVGAWSLNQHYGGWDPETDGEMKDIADPEHGVVNLGHQDPVQFMNQVGMSKVMIGLGNPWWSPSPYNALCQGVPFINPIIYWNENEPYNRANWNTQHPNLNQHDPPYVYHVHARNFTEFVEAVKTASTTEIPSFIPDHMTETAVQGRLKTLMETDWRSKAAKLLEERLKEVEEGKNAYTFEL